MEAYKKILFFLTFLLLTIFGISNCSKDNFSAVSNQNSGGDNAAGGGATTTTGGGTCSLSQVLVPINVIFVVDRSGSNAIESQDEGTEQCTNPNLTGCAPPTDPTLTFRGGSIQAFFNANQANTNFSWGFLVFSGQSATSYIQNGTQAAFGNATQMQNAITTFYADTDQDATPYLAALNSAQDAISNDPGLYLAGNQAPLYEIIFISDGYPTDALSSENPVTVDLTEIKNAITNISNLAPGRIFLSAVYYGTIDDPNAANTLQNMATTGGGQFVNADTGSSTSSISIDDLITVPIGDCP